MELDAMEDKDLNNLLKENYEIQINNIMII